MVYIHIYIYIYILSAEKKLPEGFLGVLNRAAVPNPTQLSKYGEHMLKIQICLHWKWEFISNFMFVLLFVVIWSRKKEGQRDVAI